MPAARAAYQSIGFDVRCMRGHAPASSPRAVRDGPIVCAQEAAGQAALVQPVGAFVAQQECRLGGDVGIQARGARHRHLLPARPRRPAGAGIDQMVLLPIRRGARCAVPGRWWQGHQPRAARRSPPGQRDVDRSTRRDVAAGGDPALAAETGKRFVHGPRLDHAVQIELHAGGHAQQLVARLDPVPATCHRRCGQAPAGRGRPRNRGRSQPPAGRSRSWGRPARRSGGRPTATAPACRRTRGRRGSTRRHRRSPVQLAAVDEAAEAALVAIEQGADPPRLLVRRPGHAHVAAHRPESQERRAHDWLVLACGGADWGGAIEARLQRSSAAPCWRTGGEP